MATVSYTIYSHYDPYEGENTHDNTLDDESNCPPDDSDSTSWEFDPTFKSPPAPPPRFVPASLPTPDWDSVNTSASSSRLALKDTSVASDVSSWYRSLTSNGSNNTDTVQPSPLPSLPLPPTLDKSSMQRRSLEKKDKNNWFILNAIRSNPEAHPVGKGSSSTLADIIARDPPPLPNQQQFKPPVWLEIGPSNKGFAMLQRRGWNEGEPLGPNVVRQPIAASRADMIPMQDPVPFVKQVKQEVIEVNMAGYDDVAELRRVDIIDLTASDSEQEKDSTSPSAEVEVDGAEPSGHSTSDNHGRTALLTPIPTVLKSDRLGIGLKAKTIGPYKASLKRITHNAVAMAAHIRTAEETRRKKKQFGRGRRGFHVQRKKEEADRKHLLAYMNDS